MKKDYHLSYRASANYGMVAVARSESSKIIDLFGSAVNVSAKIKRSEIISSILEVAYHACKHIKSNQRVC
jgi:hypothetical protein